MTIQNMYTLSDTYSTLISPPNTHSGVDLTVQNINDAGYIYVGNSEVSTVSFGYRLSPGHAMSFELSGKDSLYVIASNPNMRISVLTLNLEIGE